MNIEINQEAIEKMAQEYAEQLIVAKVNNLLEQKGIEQYIRNTLYHAIENRITTRLIIEVFKTLDMEEELKKQFKKLVFAHHPDRCKDENATAKRL